MLERRIGYYLIWAFFPSGMCVLISMAGFWIKLTASPARNRFVKSWTISFGPLVVHIRWKNRRRVTLGITTFLAVSTLGQTFTRGMPKVSYIKAIDVWMISCSTFVFLAIVEFAVAQVNYIKLHWPYYISYGQNNIIYSKYMDNLNLAWSEFSVFHES